MKAEIRKLIGSEKLILGTDRVLKATRQGNVEKIILASNAPPMLKRSLTKYQQVGKFVLEDAGIPNDELGTICKRPFSVAAIAILS